MLMLTHTYILQQVLNAASVRNYDLDIFVYNIVPDLLTIHPAINSRQTHKIKRLLDISPLYPKTAYIMFHLLVDDLSHYGSISPDIPDEFNPDSQGYSYIKGKPLISSILDFQKEANREISYNEAAYRSHLIVEMVYDLVIIDRITSNKTIELLTEAISATAEKKIDSFVTTINWQYGLDKADICEVIKRAHSYMTGEKILQTMKIENRIRLYTYKFGLPNDDQLNLDGITELFLQARELLDDNELFLRETAEAVKKYGWLPPII